MKRQRRNKGEGSITKTQNGKYKATITIGVGLDGKQKRKSVTRNTKREVIEAVVALKTQYGIGGHVAPKKSVQSVCEEFLDTKDTQLSRASMKNYKSCMRLFCCVFPPSMLMENITTTMIEDYFRTQLKTTTKKVSSLKRIKAVWSVLFHFALDKGYITTNPLKDAQVPFPRVVPKANTMILPTPQEFQVLLKCAYEKSLWYGVFVYLASVTGMRRGELLGLKWSAINEDNKTITINNQLDVTGQDAPLKTKSSYRTIHVTPRAFEELHKLRHTSQYVFVGDRQQTPPVSRATLDNFNHEVFKKSGMPEGFTFHDIRHYHATQLLQHGINPKVVSRRLGHSTIVTTLNVYFNYLPNLDEEASRVLDM